MKKSKTPQEPQYYVSEINSQVMNYNVYVMSAKEKILFSTLLFIVGGIVGFIFYGGLFENEDGATFATYISDLVFIFIGGIVAIKIFLKAINEALRKKRLSQLNHQFKEFLAALSTSLSSGMNVNNALLNCKTDLISQYSENSYIVKEVDEMIQGVQNNIQLEDIIKEFGIRSGIDDISNFASVFSTCYRTGGDLKKVVRRTSDIISQKIAIQSEIETKITSNKMQLNIMCSFPIFIVMFLKLISADFAKSFASVIGVIAITISIGIFIGAYILGHKIMDIKR